MACLRSSSAAVMAALARRLTRRRAAHSSPLGRHTRIAFTRLVDGREQIFVANADGSDAQMALEMPNTRARAVAWSPDGRPAVLFFG